MRREYTTDELTIIWRPELCLHAGECMKRLSKVYDPKAKPWCKPENTIADELIDN